MSKLYRKSDKARYLKEPYFDELEYRTPFRRDLARIIHSHSFRRLAGKTQLFPKHESDFFRNRLTHSLEVAQVSKSIALKFNAKLPDDYQIDLDLVEFAGLAHDLGHPPFGHQGEEVLAECMVKHGGFEGNAQTLRILTKLEKKIHDGQLDKGGFDLRGVDRRGGLNLTYRSLASIIKYDNNILEAIKKNKSSKKFLFKGYYDDESAIVDKIRSKIGLKKNEKISTIECQIMDIADDITYSTYDIEDALKAKFISPIDMLTQDNFFYEEVSDEVTKAINEKEIYGTIKILPDDIKDVLSDLLKFIFDLPKDILTGIEELKKDKLSKEEFRFLGQQYSAKYNKLIVENGYVRSNFSAQLIKYSIDSLDLKIDTKNLGHSKVLIDLSTLTRIEILKKIAFKTQILSPRLKANEHRGKRIVRKIFDVLDPKSERNMGKVPELLPRDIQVIYKQCEDDDFDHKYRTVCDYIACMTDQYAKEFYGRITSENPATIFRPI